MKNLSEYQARIARDYAALRTRCQELDHQYRDSPDPAVGFRVGHYDDDRLEIQFYDVHTRDLQRLEDEMNKATVETPPFQDKFEMYIRHVIDQRWLVLIRPRLIN